MKLGRRKPLWMLFAVMLLVGTLAVAILYYAGISGTGAAEVNVCLHLSDYDGDTLSYLKDLRVSGVRTDWLMTPDDSMRAYSHDLQDNNISLLAIIDINTLSHRIPSLEEWNKTIAEIVTSEGFNNTDAVEVWNEPNVNGTAYIPAEIYFEMLKSAYTIIKNYTDIPVVFAGVSPNIPGWQDYLKAIFAHDDAQDYFDCMGIHFYDDMTTNKEILEFVEDLTTKPIWLTETGKPSVDNGETAQAEYLSSIYSTFEPLVSKIFIYELKDKGVSSDKEDHFGLVTMNGTKKEAYEMLWKIGRE